MQGDPKPTPEDPQIARVAEQLSAAGQSIDVVAVTSDRNLLAILREAAGNSRRVLDAETPQKAAELMMAGRVGVIVIDTLITGEDSALFCEQLRSQFPDLVLIVAGTTDDQTQLIKHITSGDIYRFLHKPVSPPRAKQFIEAGLRRHLEGRTFTPADVPAPRRQWAIPTVFTGIVLAVIAATAAAFFFLRGERPQEDAPPRAEKHALAPAPSPARQPAAAGPTSASRSAAPVTGTDPKATLAAAAAAFEAGQLVAPAGNSALDLYRQVLSTHPGNSEAEAGLDRIADQLLTSAEAAMLEERIDDAANAIEAARAVRPNNMRLAFLSAQLGKERERHLIAQARQAADSGNLARAQSLLDRAAQDQKTVSPLLAQARREIVQRRVGTNADNLLKQANERLQQDKLIAPQGDSAETYILAALAADPTNLTAQQARRTLADQTLAKAKQAIDAADFTAAAQWLAHAEALGGNVRRLQRDLEQARQGSARAQQQAELGARLDERIRQGMLMAPELDNAAYYWRELKSTNPQNARLQPALQSIGTGLVQQSQASLGKGDVAAAQAALQEAKALGFASPALTSLEQQVAAAREHAAFMDNVVNAGTLARDKYVEPRYPDAAARKGVSGWVEVDFTVAVDGGVKDVSVSRADPTGVFDEAAIRAVSQWRYRPVMHNGRAVEQRARLRLRFALQKP